MALFPGGAVPMHRQLKGLLLPGLPRGRIHVGGDPRGAASPPLVPPLELRTLSRFMVFKEPFLVEWHFGLLCPGRA
jgi:hypothetical protein